jgi:hypothetical protein
MEMRIFGSTGLRLSVLGFGCGAVGGLMVRGDPLDQERTTFSSVPLLTFSSANRNQTCAISNSVARVPSSLKERAISMHSCAKRRYFWEVVIQRRPPMLLQCNRPVFVPRMLPAQRLLLCSDA